MRLEDLRCDDLIGAPYKPRGRDEGGLDCLGLILVIAARLGKPMPDVRYEKSDPALMSLAERMGVHKIDALEPGCIIEMECARRLHLGFAIDRDRMIHAPFEGVRVDPISKYTKTIRGFYGFN
jgi:cell wall-associated NlpC family hydrolase